MFETLLHESADWQAQIRKPNDVLILVFKLLLALTHPL